MPVRKTTKTAVKASEENISFDASAVLEKIAAKPISSGSKEIESGVQEALKNLADLKLKLGQNLDKISENLLEDLNNLRNFKVSITQEKQKTVIGFSEEQEVLNKELKKLKSNFDEEKRNLEIKKQRDEEQYQYNLTQKHRLEEDELVRDRQLKTAELQREKEELLQRKNEIAQMQKELANLPQTIEKAVKEAEIKLNQQLAEKHQREINQLELSKNNELKIAELKITNLEAMIKSQTAETESLKRQLIEASKQLKEIAVSVINSHGNDSLGNA